jgi:hypothetical protein
LASRTKHHVSCDGQSVGAAAIRERQYCDDFWLRRPTLGRVAS